MLQIILPSYISMLGEINNSLKPFSCISILRSLALTSYGLRLFKNEVYLPNFQPWVECCRIRAAQQLF